jgi:hypothetical protein
MVFYNGENTKKPERSLAPFRHNRWYRCFDDISTRTTQLDLILIIHFAINIKDLFFAGKNYPWPRPNACPCCGGKRLWGHGYTSRYFDGSPKLIWLKRYRCIDCHSVHTLHPTTHWRRFQSPIAAILKSLRRKIIENRWVDGLSRQKQQYWLRGFKTQIKVNHPCDGMITLKLLKDLLHDNVIIATHSLKWFQMILRGSLICVPAV